MILISVRSPKRRPQRTRAGGRGWKGLDAFGSRRRSSPRSLPSCVSTRGERESPWDSLPTSTLTNGSRRQTVGTREPPATKFPEADATAGMIESPRRTNCRKRHPIVPNFNRIILAGNLVRDPDIRYVQSGAPVTTFTLAVNRRGKGGDSVDYIDVVAWNKLAETSNTYLRRGMPVLVEGRLAVRSYESKGGEKHRAAEVVLSALQLLDCATSDRSEPAVDEVESEAGAVA